MAGRGDKRRAGQNAIGVKTNSFALLEEIIVGISIDERRDFADDQAFLAIRDVNKCVEEIDPLLFVFWYVLAAGVEREGAWKGNAGCIFRVDSRALAQRRDRRADNAFRKSFLVDLGNVENFKTAGAIRGVKVFATQNDV